MDKMDKIKNQFFILSLKNKDFLILQKLFNMEYLDMFKKYLAKPKNTKNQNNEFTEKGQKMGDEKGDKKYFSLKLLVFLHVSHIKHF